MSWKLPIGWPNCSGSFAYCTDSCRHRSTIPSAIAATPARFLQNVAFEALRPPPPRHRTRRAGGRSRRARRTGTAARWGSASPSRAAAWTARGPACRGRERTTPPCARSGGLPSSSLQMNTIVSAYGPLVMNVLDPLRTYSSPSRRAVDLMGPKASDPESGSVIAHAPTLSSVSKSSTHRSFWALVPFPMTAEEVSPTDTAIVVTMPGHTRHSSMIGIIEQRRRGRRHVPRTPRRPRSPARARCPS